MPLPLCCDNRSPPIPPKHLLKLVISCNPVRNHSKSSTYVHDTCRCNICQACFCSMQCQLTFRVAEPEGLARRLPILANGVTDQGLGGVSAANGAGNAVLYAVVASIWLCQEGKAIFHPHFLSGKDIYRFSESQLRSQSLSSSNHLSVRGYHVPIPNRALRSKTSIYHKCRAAKKYGTASRSASDKTLT